MKAWIVSAAAGVAHAVLVLAALLALGHPMPGPAAVVGLLLLGAAPVWWWFDGVRSPLVLAALGLVAAVVLEIVTPGPWVTVLGADTVTVGTPVLWSYAVASPLWLAACGLAGLGEASLRRPERPRWGRSALAAVAVTALWFLAVAATGLGRGWAASPPPAIGYGLVPAGILVVGATVLLRRVRLVTPWLVLVVATGAAAVALWVQAPAGGADAAGGLLVGSSIWLSLAVLVGLVEALVRGVVRLSRSARRGAALSEPEPTRAPA